MEKKTGGASGGNIFVSNVFLFHGPMPYLFFICGVVGCYFKDFFAKPFICCFQV